MIELGSYDRWECPSGKSFVRYLQDAQTTHRLDQFQLDRVLQRPGGAVLLLDGLDEIFDRNRRKDALNSIHEFSNKYRDTRIIVTSRVIGYEQRQLSDAGFSHFMLQDLDEAQIADFLDRWYATNVRDARDRQAKQERIANSIRESRAIRELADNPLLLTMMSFLNLHQVLPRDRVKLYERMTEVLLHQWDFERLDAKGVVEYREKAEMLRRLADHMQNAPDGLWGNIIAGDDLKRIFRAYLKNELDLPNAYQVSNDLVEQLRVRNFILCYRGGGTYSFVHRTFLEYFCATALAQQFHQKLSLDFLIEGVFALHWQDERWHEVLRLLLGLVAETSAEQAGAVIDYLLRQQDHSFGFRNVLLAAQCYQEVRNPRALSAIRLRIQEALEKSLRFDFPSSYLANKVDMESVNRGHRKAVAILASSFLLDNPTIWLKECAQHAKFYGVRIAAMQELARHWSHDPDTLPWLKDHAQNADEWGAREDTVREIARGWQPAPEILLWLRTRAINDSNRFVRSAAVQELVRGWRNDSDTLPLLKDIAQNDADSLVRITARDSLAYGWKGDIEVSKLLRDLALGNPEW